MKVIGMREGDLPEIMVHDFRKAGYLPEALNNFLALLGWNPGDDREKMPVAELIRLFDLPGINQSNARFDEKKLAHMNMVYLHELPADQFYERAKAYLVAEGFFASGLPDETYLRSVLGICQVKVRSIEDLKGFIGYFFSEDFPIDPKAREKIFSKGDPKARLSELRAALVTADFSSDAALEAVLQGLAASHGTATGDYIHPGRLAVSGTSVGPSFYGLYRVLGRDRVLSRIDRLIA